MLRVKAGLDMERGRLRVGWLETAGTIALFALEGRDGPGIGGRLETFERGEGTLAAEVPVGCAASDCILARAPAETGKTGLLIERKETLADPAKGESVSQASRS